MPLERAFDDRELKAEVIYDAHNVVQEVHVIEGGDVIRPKPRFARQPSTTRPVGNDTRAF